MKIFKVLFSFFLIIILDHGGGSSSGGIQSGQFKDSNVSGLTYTSGDQVGITSFDFIYVVGEELNFLLVVSLWALLKVIR